jgi:hypothetical protein
MQDMSSPSSAGVSDTEMTLLQRLVASARRSFAVLASGYRLQLALFLSLMFISTVPVWLLTA